MSAAMMTDLDAEIVALRVAGESEREICRGLGCTMGRCGRRLMRTPSASLLLRTC
jgi:hypothetical protein